MNVKECVAEARHLTGASPEKILAWAFEKFGDQITVASSFGLEDVMLIDLAAGLASNPDIFFLDTDLLFPETYQTVKAMEARYPIRLRRLSPILTLTEQAEQRGEALWSGDPDFCCNIRKVEPLNRALGGYQAWVTGIRREQSPTRAQTEAVEWDVKHNLVKINPLVMLTQDEVWHYVKAHQVPYNPLHDVGFPSIGCMPCTRAVKPGEDPRAGRWAAFDKKECGLHL